MKTWMLLPIAVLLGCPSSQEESEIQQICDDLCEQLVTNCGYEAYPNFDSCLQGCLWYDDQGADVAGELDCVESAIINGSDEAPAECDTFAILECEHRYGLTE